MKEQIRAKAFLNLSLLYSYKHNLGKMDSCLQLAWQYNHYFDNLTQRQYCNFYGLCKLWQDSISEASTSFSKGIILGETVKAADQTMAGLYGNYAMTFYQVWEYEKAASLYQKNLQLLETTINDKTDMPITYLNLGACFIHLKQPDAAKAYLEIGIPLAEKNGTTNNIVLIYLYENLGAVLYRKDNMTQLGFT